MDSKKRFFLESLAFLVLILWIVSEVNAVLMIKDNSGFSNNQGAFNGFYNLKAGSADVLLIGSSHCQQNLSPQSLYNSSGIRSYNLGSSGQKLINSYYWLKEALKYQHPKAIVLETWSFFIDPAINEAAIRKGFMSMKLSPLKIQGIHAACKDNPKLDEASFYFHNLRFHERWKSLKAEDFMGKQLKERSETKGYLPNFGHSRYRDFKALDLEGNQGTENVLDVNMKYIKKIVELCDEKSVKLIFLTTPSSKWTAEKHNFVERFGNQHNIKYIDFNTKEYFSKLDNFDYYSDAADLGGHLNVRGAEKVTLALGVILSDNLMLKRKKDIQWEAGRDFHKWIKKCFVLHETDDFLKYLETLKDKRFAFFVLKPARVNYVNKNISKMLKIPKENINENYASAFFKNEKASEAANKNKLITTGFLDDKKLKYTINLNDSGGSIVVNNYNERVSFTPKRKGISFIVYDYRNMKVIDKVTFTKKKGKLVAVR